MVQEKVKEHNKWVILFYKFMELLDLLKQRYLRKSGIVKYVLKEISAFIDNLFKILGFKKPLELYLSSIFGFKHFCPCCNSYIKLFLPHQSEKQIKIRMNARCPRCGCMERHRLLWLFMKKETRIFEDNLRMLHFAPKYSLFKNFKDMENLEYISSDLNKKWTHKKINVENIPYPDDSFDVILISHVLEHVNDDIKAIKELFRILKPGGFTIILTPFDKNLEETMELEKVDSINERMKLSDHADHQRVYGRDFSKRVDSVGFEVKIEDYFQQFRSEDVERFGLNEEDVIFLCKKLLKG